MKNENTASVHEEVTMQLDCKMFICKNVFKRVAFVFLYRRTLYRLVTENIPPLPSSALK